MKIVNYLSRNNRLLADGEGYRPKAEANRVNLNWWHIKYGQNVQNLGDMLSKVVVDYMCDYFSINSDASVKKTKNLYAAGSILFFENQDAVVWGTGSLSKLDKNLNTILHQKFLRRLDVRAVRGPKTRENLLKMGVKCPEVYGDPVMLLPLFYNPVIEKTGRTLVLPHFCDGQEESYGNDVVVSGMATDDWRRIVDLIISSDKVISSSLHGIIIAESYGVPAVLLQPKRENNLFKYEDYYLGTGRKTFKIVESVDEALKCELSILDNLRLKDIQKELITSFPVDIWKL